MNKIKWLLKKSLYLYTLDAKVVQSNLSVLTNLGKKCKCSSIAQWIWVNFIPHWNWWHITKQKENFLFAALLTRLSVAFSNWIFDKVTKYSFVNFQQVFFVQSRYKLTKCLTINPTIVKFSFDFPVKKNVQNCISRQL